MKEDSSFNIIKLNIWEEKLFDNPLLSLLLKISELESKISILEKGNCKNKKKWKGRLKEFGWQLLNFWGKLDWKTIWMSKDDSSKEVDILNEYEAYKSAIKNYKQALTEFCEDKKLILLIDELDRCLPEYQIKTLEILHHFFDVPNLIVVIAMDKAQLEHSIKNIFGESLNTIGYLNKFINYEVELPQGSVEQYINTLLNKIKLPQEYKQESFVQNITNILKCLKLQPRDIHRVIDEIDLIYNEKLSINELQILQDVFFSQNGKTFLDPVLISLLVILKNYKREFYNKYFINQNRNSLVLRNQIDLLNSTSIFKQFLDELEKNIFESPINNVLSTMHDKYFFLNLINLIFPIADFDSKSVLSYYVRLLELNGMEGRTYIIRYNHHLRLFYELCVLKVKLLDC